VAVESAVIEHQVEGTRQRLARSVLEQTNKAFDLFLLGEPNILFGCDLVAADSDALVVKINRGTYLVPWGDPFSASNLARTCRTLRRSACS
jgi:hypothetical protein